MYAKPRLVTKLTYWNYIPEKQEITVNNCQLLGTSELAGPNRPGSNQMFPKETHKIFLFQGSPLIVSEKDIINIQYV